MKIYLVLSTLKKRFDDVRFLFSHVHEKERLGDFELLMELRNEIINLDMQESLSITEFRKRCDNPKLPSVDTIKRQMDKTWEELMEEIGFDYRKVKVEKLTRNLRGK